MKPPCSASSAKWPRKCCATILAVTIASLAIRLPELRQRPMHCDEAVHAIKFSDLLERGFYVYNPAEFHGPTLNYLTLIPAYISSATKLTEVNELTLRIVPVFFGVLLILLLLLAADGLGPGAAIFAAILTAISPAMVFYSRYYIHETLLVCFTFGAIVCGYRYTQSKNVKWALLTGMFLGLMHATKETSIIAFGSMALSLLLTLIVCRQRNDAGPDAVKAMKLSHFVAGLAAAVMVSALFYSSFLTNPNGILDSFRTYTTYFSRSGNNALHIHPWYYYLKMLIYSRYGNGPIWSEAVIILLAAIGFIVAIRGTSDEGRATKTAGLLIFIAFYTAIMTVVYSILPYKTPWCMLGFLHGMILLAGVGTAAIIKLAPNALVRVLVGLLLIVGIAHLAWQAYLGNYKLYADSRNPYVYAHTTTDVFAIVGRVEAIAKVYEDGRNINIQVICPQHDYWPLPWYLRTFANVAWRDKVTDDVVSAPLIIASPKVEHELLAKLYQLPPPGRKNLYVPLFDTYTELRPQVELRGYVTKDLWDRFKQQGT
jgi:uncharacterized protein (TIGR03663 family)